MTNKRTGNVKDVKDVKDGKDSRTATTARTTTTAGWQGQQGFLRDDKQNANPRFDCPLTGQCRRLGICVPSHACRAIVQSCGCQLVAASCKINLADYFLHCHGAVCDGIV
jgi:hypothetical protein